MALIKCPECGKEISSLAKTCPNCGYVLPKKEKRQKSKKQKNIIITLIVVCSVIVLLFAFLTPWLIDSYAYEYRFKYSDMYIEDGGEGFYGYSITEIKMVNKNIRTIEIPETYKGKPIFDIGYRMFDNYYARQMEEVYLPARLISISDDAFAGCSNLTSISLPSNVKKIGKAVFRDCSSLSSVGLSDKLISIGELAFYNCSSLTNIIIPDSVISIGSDAFWDCTSLTSVYIGNGVMSIGDYAFAGCSNNLTIRTKNPYVISYCESKGIQYESK